MAAPLVLVVDDDPASLKLTRAVLIHHGYAILSAASGAEAARAASSRPPDVGVLDINLPDMSGIDLLRQLRQDPHTSSMPAIAVTAFAMPDDRDRILAAGFDSHIPKPIDADQLVMEVRQLLEGP